MTERVIFLNEIRPVVPTRPHVIPEYVEWLRKGSTPPPVWLHPIKQPYKFKFAIADAAHADIIARRARLEYLLAELHAVGDRVVHLAKVARALANIAAHTFAATSISGAPQRIGRGGVVAMSAFGGKSDMTLCGNPLLRSLLGVKRTWPIAVHMSAYDPKRT